jgi:Rrf2 family protein
MISTKGRYALRVMIDLAQHEGEGNIPLKDIAERQDISKKYLEIIVKDLVKGGMLNGVSGKGGGYSLCRKAEEYTVGEIIELMEGTLAPVACLVDGVESCPRSDSCLTLPMWKEYYEMIHQFFYGKKLSDLLGDRDPVYYI